MFELFHKRREPEADYAALARRYYQEGTACMDQGRLEEAMLWLSRADTIYSARDEIYEAVGDKLIDDCSERIGQLEEAPILHNELPASVQEMAEALTADQVRAWGLLALARLVKVGERLSALPGCEVLGELGWAVDTVLSSVQGKGGDLERLGDLGDRIYTWSGEPAYFAGGAVSVPGGPDLQVFDLNGLLLPETLMSYLSAHVDRMTGKGAEVEPDAVTCALPLDYCVRTAAVPAEDHPLIQRELACIQEDLDFLRGSPAWTAVGERAAAYKDWDVLVQ